jgi:hypothetical protein
MKLTIENDNMKISLDIEEKRTGELSDKLIAYHSCDDKPPSDCFDFTDAAEKERIDWTETHADQLRSEMRRLGITQAEMSEATDIPIWKIRKYAYRHYKAITLRDLNEIKGVLHYAG